MLCNKIIQAFLFELQNISNVVLQKLQIKTANPFELNKNRNKSPNLNLKLI
jgi:hypothetical protein